MTMTLVGTLVISNSAFAAYHEEPDMTLERLWDEDALVIKNQGIVLFTKRVRLIPIDDPPPSELETY